MTDNEIIKMLGHCFIDHSCNGCPLENHGEFDCMGRMGLAVYTLICRQQAEIERFSDIGKMYSEIKSEAIKEFAERVCEGRVSNDPVVIAVRCAVKEMTEGKDAGKDI